MRVLFVDQQINTCEMGGSMYSLDTLLRLLNKKGIEAHLLTLNSKLNEVNNPTYRIIESQILFYNPIILNTYLFKELKKRYHDYDLIHIYDPTLLIPAGIFKIINKNTKIIGNLNSYYFCTNYSLMDGNCHKRCNLFTRIGHSIQGRMLKLFSIPFRIYQQLGFKYINNLDGFTADSEFVKRTYIEYGLKKYIEIIYEIIDFDAFKTKDKGNIVKNEGFNILYVGRLEKNKGIDLLLKAVFSLKERDIHIHIVGKGNEESYLKEMAKSLNMSDRVFFHGYIPYEKLSNVYSGVDVFVHPSRWPEPFGRTIVEAMYFGVALILSNIGAPPMFSKDCALIFERNNHRDLAEKIRILYENEKLRKKLSINAKNEVKRFYPEKIVKKLIKFYDKTLEME